MATPKKSKTDPKGKSSKPEQKTTTDPKKKGTKSGAKKPPTEEELREQMEKEIAKLREELDKERKEHEFCRLERDKIRTFWDITKVHLEESKHALSMKDVEIENTSADFQAKIRLCKKKVNYLTLEHKTEMMEMKTEGAIAAKTLKKEEADLERELQNDIHSLKVEKMEQKFSYEKIIKEIKQNHEKEITKLRNKIEKRVEEIEAIYEKRIQKEREAQDLKWKTELFEIHQRKSLHANELKKNHEKVFRESLAYYKDIIRQNINQILSLKEVVSDMQIKESMLEKELAKALQQKNSLEEPLQAAKEEIIVLQGNLRNYESEKAALVGTTRRLKLADEELKNLKLEHDLLADMHEKLQKDRDKLQEELNKVSLEAQEKGNFRNVLLEKKVEVLTDTLEKKEAQLSEGLTASNLNLEELMDSKNKAINDLQFELALTRKAYDDLQKTCEAKLKACGVLENQLGLKPLDTSTVGLPTARRIINVINGTLLNRKKAQRHQEAHEHQMQPSLRPKPPSTHMLSSS